MSKLITGLTALTGGVAGALDSVDGAALEDGDKAEVRTDIGVFNYYLNATSGATANSPDIISPASNAGTKRWELVGFVGILLTDVNLKNAAETLVILTSAAGVIDLDFVDGNVFSITLTEDITTMTISNPPDSGKSGAFTLFVFQDTTGGYSITWPAAVDAGDNNVDLETAASSLTVYTGVTIDAGASYILMKGFSRAGA